MAFKTTLLGALPSHIYIHVPHFIDSPQNNILVMGCLEHIVPKYSLPNGEFEGRVVKTTTKITCIDFDHKGERVAVASEYAPKASSLACVKASGRCALNNVVSTSRNIGAWHA
jgi:hypothetical protein